MRPDIECLERRWLPSGIDFLSALGLGVTGPNASIHSNAIATDPAGDTFVTGSFLGAIDLDPSTNAATFTSANTQDTFVAKYGPTGSLLWASTFAGESSTTNGITTHAVSQGSAIAVDGSGNVFVAGGFSGSVKLTGSSGVTRISSPFATTEAYVAKLDASGRLAWVDAVAGTLYDVDQAYALALDGSGGAVFAGSFADSATFGTTTLQAGGASDAFVARVDGAGQFLWAVASRGASGSNAEIHGVAVDGSGHVDLAGFFSGTVDFDPSASTTNLTSAGSVDALIWKLDASGHFVWGRSYGSTDYDSATAIAVDASGNLYATGGFTGTVDFGIGASPDILSTQATLDTFVLKVAPNGNEAWVEGLIGPSGTSKGQGIAVDPFGTIHVGGSFQGTRDFDPGPGTDNLTSVGGNDAFIAGLDPTGRLIYALQAGMSDFNATLGVAVNASGTVAITGSYSGSIAFGSTTLPAIRGASVFVARVATQTPPAAPSAPVLEASSDTGISHSDGITSATSPILDVNAAGPTNTVELLRNGAVVGTRIGPGAITDPGPLPDGTYTYTALQVSPAGLTGPAGPSTSVTILTRPPATLGNLTLFPADDSGALGDGITNVRQPRLSIAANAATTIEVVDASGAVVGSTYAATNGVYPITPSRPFAEGIYQLQARAVDVAGNVGSPGPAFRLTIDATPPPSPTILTLVAADDSGTVGDNLTNVRQPRLSGTAEAGSTVQVVDGSGTVHGLAVAAVDGTFTAKVSSPLADGSYSFQARATDPAGNRGASGPALALRILATPPAAPAAPTLLPADASGGPSLTNIRQPRLTGRTLAGAPVQVIGTAGNVLASTTSAADGSYVAKLASPLADGTYSIRVVVTDAAGNVSPPGTPFVLTILATPPAAPSTPILSGLDDSGTVGDRITNVRQPRLTGTTGPGLTVRLVNATNQVLGTSTATTSGSVTVSPSTPLADGTYVLRFVALDAAGNVSTPGGSISLVILGTPPSRPAAPSLLAADDTGLPGDGMTAVRRPRIVGTAVPGGRVDWLAADGSVLASTTVTASNGSYQLQPPSALPNAIYPVKVREVDVAGNVSPASVSYSLTVRVANGDDFGDGRTDLSVFRASDSTFWVQKPTTGALFMMAYGGPGDVPVNGDFFGDGHDDIAIYRPSTSTFYAFDPATSATTVVQLGQAGSVPVPGDFDGDGKTDFAVFRPANSTFTIKMSATGSVYSKVFAIPGDVPAPADYLGLGHAQIAVYRPSTSTFYVTDPVTGVGKVVAIGAAGGVPVPADFDGDGKADFATYQPSTSTFNILMSATNSVYSHQYGGPGDIPVVGDYFGNGRADLAVFRPSTATYYAFDIPTSAGRISQWGTPNAVKPTLAPITTWFSFGSSTIASLRMAGPGSTATLIPLTPDTMTTLDPAPTRKAAVTDRAIFALSLERWRPGDRPTRLGP